MDRATIRLWNMAVFLAVFFALVSVVFGQQNNDPRGDHISSKANQALEQCFDSTGAFLCMPAFGTVTGTGFVNTIPKWIGASTLGDSQLVNVGDVTSGIALDFNVGVAPGAIQTGIAFEIDIDNTGAAGGSNLFGINFPDILDIGGNRTAIQVNSNFANAFSVSGDIPSGSELFAGNVAVPLLSATNNATGFFLALTNSANHTGGIVRGGDFRLAGSDADAEESGLYFEGDWDQIFELEGTNFDAFETHIKYIEPSQDNDITFPDASGTLTLDGASFPLTVDTQVTTGEIAMQFGNDTGGAEIRWEDDFSNDSLRVDLTGGSSTRLFDVFAPDNTLGFFALAGPGGQVIVMGAAPAAGLSGTLFQISDIGTAMDGNDLLRMMFVAVNSAAHTGTDNWVTGIRGRHAGALSANATENFLSTPTTEWDHILHVNSISGNEPDGNHWFMDVPAVTANRTVTWPDAGGTVPLVNGTPLPAYGEMYVSTPAGTSTTSGTPIKAAGTTTLGTAAQFDMPASNRLRYTGATTTIFRCGVSSSTMSGTGSILLSVFLSDTGTVDTTTEIRREHPNTTDEGASSTSFIVELAQNDYVELFLDTDAGNPTITVERMTLTCNKVN